MSPQPDQVRAPSDRIGRPARAPLVDRVRSKLAVVRNRIADAGADPDQVTIVAATKRFGPEVVLAALDAGLIDIGESFAQEMVGKVEALGDREVRWHFVGQLQRNKVKMLAPHVQVWQSIDREAVGAEVARRAPGAVVLVEINVTDDPGRGGCRPDEAAGLVARARQLGLVVQGLMTIAPRPGGDAQAAFRLVRRLADDLGLPVRSMGMSGDLELAVQEGSTMVRVGTALFGERE